MRRKDWFFGVLLFFFVVSFSYPIREIKVPNGTTFLFYVKDIKNLESNMEKSGFLQLPLEYRTYLIDYLKNDYPVLRAYQELRNMEAGNFMTSLIGEAAILNIKGEEVFIINLDKKSKYFVTLLNIFQVKGQFNGHYVEFLDNGIILSRSSSLINLYKKSSSKTDDVVLKNQNITHYDVLYYAKGNTILHPFFDSLLVKDSKEKSFSVAMNFQKRDIIVCTSPSLFEQSGIRSLEAGQMIPATSLIFLDMLLNPYELFLTVFGEKNLNKYKNDFRNLFENQISVAIPSLSPEIEPSFLVVLKTKREKSKESEKFIFRFFEEVIGEKDWNTKSIGMFKVNYAKKSPYCFLSRDGYILISDSATSLDDTLKVMSKKIFSVWDEKDNQEIRPLTSKPFTLSIDFSSIADSVYKSMLKKMNVDSSQKEALKIYTRAIRKLGSLSGYGESRKDYNYFYFTLQRKGKEE